MTRARPTDRRLSVNEKIVHVWANGNEQRLIVTFGFDASHKVREVFCADFKAGTDMHTMIVDACVLLSLLLQHGYDVTDLTGKLAGSPWSILGTLVNAAVKVEKQQ